jgi:hypothetical protein
VLGVIGRGVIVGGIACCVWPTTGSATISSSADVIGAALGMEAA